MVEGWIMAHSDLGHEYYRRFPNWEWFIVSSDQSLGEKS